MQHAMLCSTFGSSLPLLEQPCLIQADDANFLLGFCFIGMFKLRAEQNTMEYHMLATRIIKTLNNYLWVKFDGNSTSMSQHQEIT